MRLLLFHNLHFRQQVLFENPLDYDLQTDNQKDTVCGYAFLVSVWPPIQDICISFKFLT